MPGTHGKGERKHTPIVSRQQQKFFGAVASGTASSPSLSKKMAQEHLSESRGKRLPRRVKGAAQRA